MHNYQFEKFPLSGLHSLFFINYMDIIFVEANRSYCEILMINGEKKSCVQRVWGRLKRNYLPQFSFDVISLSSST